jgi:hypothetical protein
MILHTYSQNKEKNTFSKEEVKQWGQNIDTTDTPVAKCLIMQAPRVSIGCRYSSKGFGKGIDQKRYPYREDIQKPECGTAFGEGSQAGAVPGEDPEFGWHIAWARAPPKIPSG